MNLQSVNIVKTLRIPRSPWEMREGRPEGQGKNPKEPTVRVWRREMGINKAKQDKTKKTDVEEQS